MAESKRYILNKTNGFNVMVNMFLIRYIYSHTEKSNKFMVQGSARKKSKDFFKEIVGISRPRMSRILCGENFEMSQELREQLYSMFNLKEQFFLRGGSFVEVHLLTELDWKCYFHQKYGVAFDLKLIKAEIKEKHSKVENELNKLTKKNVIENEYSTDSALYRIYYYFKNGNTYKEESRLSKFLRALSDLKVDDWEEIENNTKQLEEYQRLLNKHIDYVNAVVNYNHAKGK